jgi:hypothetical protein
MPKLIITIEETRVPVSDNPEDIVFAFEIYCELVPEPQDIGKPSTLPKLVDAARFAISAAMKLTLGQPLIEGEGTIHESKDAAIEKVRQSRAETAESDTEFPADLEVSELIN